MLRKSAVLGVVAGVLATTGFAQDGRIKSDIPHLDHVFLIKVMEEPWLSAGHRQSGHEPYLNNLIAKVGSVNFATNYSCSSGHPSLTNYLEIRGEVPTSASAATTRRTGAARHARRTLRPRLVNADNGGGNAPVSVDTGNICPHLLEPALTPRHRQWIPGTKLPGPSLLSRILT